MHGPLVGPVRSSVRKVCEREPEYNAPSVGILYKSRRFRAKSDESEARKRAERSDHPHESIPNGSNLDLRPEQNVILIHGKGGPYGKSARHRLVPLNPHSQKALDAYLAVRMKLVETRKVETRALFFGLRNNEDGSAISVRSVFRMILHMTKVRGHPDAPASVTPCLCDPHARQRLSSGCDRTETGTRQSRRDGSLCTGFDSIDDGHVQRGASAREGSLISLRCL
jgi:hypothetical protein